MLFFGGSRCFLQFQAQERAGWGRNALQQEALKVANRIKYSQHQALAAELAATGDKTLVLVDADTWLGMSAAGGIPHGRNNAGEALMLVRSELAAAARP